MIAHVQARRDFPRLNCDDCREMEKVDGETPMCEAQGRGCPIPQLEPELDCLLDVWRIMNGLRNLSPVPPAEAAGRCLSPFELELLGSIETEMTRKEA